MPTLNYSLDSAVHCPALLHAIWLNETDLAVYRSPLVADNSEVYEPVAEILNSFRHRIVLAEIVDDEAMMFGQGYLTIYRVVVSD